MRKEGWKRDFKEELLRLGDDVGCLNNVCKRPELF